MGTPHTMGHVYCYIIWHWGSYLQHNQLCLFWWWLLIGFYVSIGQISGLKHIWTAVWICCHLFPVCRSGPAPLGLLLWIKIWFDLIWLYWQIQEGQGVVIANGRRHFCFAKTDFRTNWLNPRVVEMQKKHWDSRPLTLWPEALLLDCAVSANPVINKLTFCTHHVSRNSGPRSAVIWL